MISIIKTFANDFVAKCSLMESFGKPFLVLGFEEYFHSSVIRGRWYDYNFLRFFPIFGEKLPFFLNTNVMINFFQNLALFCVKNANFFAKFFGENI
jgi:hypothetical protein